ncbi:hypothetical protein HBI04_212930 [Parastagonospora nodorum]|nr:hypothetical protein HBI06_160380 [Parastagonospora nodorum]KAH4259753.1 hypothetical protein HBI04_212930 [Parastagonospora nodorum]
MADRRRAMPDRRRAMPDRRRAMPDRRRAMLDATPDLYCQSVLWCLAKVVTVETMVLVHLPLLPAPHLDTTIVIMGQALGAEACVWDRFYSLKGALDRTRRGVSRPWLAFGHARDTLRVLVSLELCSTCRPTAGHRSTTVAAFKQFLRGHYLLRIEKGPSCEDMDYTRDYVPIQDLDRSYHYEMFSPFNYSTSEYTLHPTEGNVSERWMALGQDSGHFLIPVSEGHKYDLDIKRHVTVPEGVAEQESFLVSLDVMHQIHCLDSLRESLWYNRDWYSVHQEQHPKLSVHKAHTNHCLDALRERLMCLSDITFLPLVYIDREGWTLPDFERRHKCHNFEATREWAYKHKMPDTAVTYQKIAGPEKILTAFPGFYDIYPERNNSDHEDLDHKHLDNMEHNH